MCRLADRIEQAIADGVYTPAQEAEQLKRLRIVQAAYERGGDEEATKADSEFINGGIS